ncbi:hypothetical protein CLV58_1318 [Spirosoma oryzae]|uniref:Uncharacterized protein n=1 Tax=Spirosoma oryzae TaxID=1469603 RepID=A0A2T0S305_9BACT|nr:hypothetical protein [Spirosoma oryzae]PRY27790.1 hypothetical protein CLV58_1318 [Spirosoma oryzae]
MNIPVPITNSKLVSNQIEAGVYPAVLFRIIQLGTHMESYCGQTPKPVRKLLLSFVVPGLNRQVRNEFVPFTVHTEFTESLNQNANLRKAVSKLVGRDMFLEDGERSTPDKPVYYDLVDLLGMAGLLTLKSRDTGAGRYVTDIDGYAPLAEDDMMPDNPYELTFFSINNFDPTQYLIMSDRIQAKIRASAEWKMNQDTWVPAVEKAQQEWTAEEQYGDELP